MAILIFPKNTGQIKPASAYKLNSSHALSKGMIGGWLLNSHGISTDLYHQEFVLSSYGGSGSAIFSPARFPYNTATLFDGTNSAIIGGTVVPRLQVQFPFSIVIAFKLTAWTSPNRGLFSNDADGSSTIVSGASVGLDTTTGKFLALTGNNTAAIGTATGNRRTNSGTYGFSAASIGGWEQWVAVFISNGITLLYRNGIQDNATTVSGSATSMVYGGRQFRLGKVLSIGANGPSAQISHFYMYNRPITPDEAMWLYREPYAMLRQPAKSYYTSSAIYKRLGLLGVG